MCDKFSGVLENVVNFFWFIVEEVRVILVWLGYCFFNEIFGCVDLLKVWENVELMKIESLNLDCLIKLLDICNDWGWLNYGVVYNNGFVLDDELLDDEEI